RQQQRLRAMADQLPAAQSAGSQGPGGQGQAAEAEECSAFHSVTVVGVEAQLDAEGLGQLAALQAVDLVEAVVEGVQLCAAGLVGEQFSERALQGGQLLAGGSVLLVDALGQLALVVAEQAAQAVLVGAQPQALGAGQ